jgi:predicted DCC family thiol-disulfide oxidoreductase YuxK
MNANEPRRKDPPLEQTDLAIIYDGECPFCSAYVRLVRLQQAVGPVTLIDARRHPQIVATLRQEGIDLDDTMAVTYGGAVYAGAEAVELLSLFSSEAGLINRLMARLLRDKDRARRYYPLLRAGRNLTLKLLRRKRLGVAGQA